MRQQADHKRIQLDRRFYVYEHWRPDLNIPFYVGKGSGNRARVVRRGRHYNHIVNKLGRLGLSVEIRVIADSLSEQDAFDLEIKRIAKWRDAGVSLLNRTSGGEGPSGWKRSAAHSQKLLLANSGRIVSDETRRKISESLKGREFSIERRMKISVANKGRPLSDAHREKLRIAQTLFMQSPEARKNVAIKSTGRTHSEQARKVFSAVHKGKIVSDETRQKIKAARRRQVISDETKQKISASMRKFRAQNAVGKIEPAAGSKTNERA